MAELVSLETTKEIIHQYGYWAVFFGICLENTGLPLPGETITLTGGFFAGNGELNYWFVLGSAFGGAVLGDNCGYWLGRWGSWTIVQRVAAFFRLPEEKLLFVQEKFRENARYAVIFGRFIALLRIFAGPLAGIARMPYKVFCLCNAFGAFLWAIATVSLAYFVGRTFELSQLASSFSALGFAALLLFVVAIFLQKSFASALPRLLACRAQQKAGS